MLFRSSMSDLKIHKYIVPVSGAGIETKEGAEIISVGSQGKDVVVWVIENPECIDLTML